MKMKPLVPPLPPLIVHGQPKVLVEMTQDELQHFVPDMLKCEFDIASTGNICLSDYDQPKWWPSELVWGLTISKVVPQNQDKTTYLRHLITSCYEFYKLEFILYLFDYHPGEPLRFSLEEQPDRTYMLKPTFVHKPVWFFTNYKAMGLLALESKYMSQAEEYRSGKSKFTSNGGCNGLGSPRTRSLRPEFHRNAISMDEYRIESGSYDSLRSPFRRGVSIMGSFSPRHSSDVVPDDLDFSPFSHYPCSFCEREFDTQDALREHEFGCISKNATTRQQKDKLEYLLQLGLVPAGSEASTGCRRSEYGSNRFPSLQQVCSVGLMSPMGEIMRAAFNERPSARSRGGAVGGDRSRSATPTDIVTRSTSRLSTEFRSDSPRPDSPVDSVVAPTAVSTRRIFPKLYRPLRIITHYHQLKLTRTEQRQWYRRKTTAILNKKALVLYSQCRRPHVSVTPLSRTDLIKWVGVDYYADARKQPLTGSPKRRLAVQQSPVVASSQLLTQCSCEISTSTPSTITRDGISDKVDEVSTSSCSQSKSGRQLKASSKVTCKHQKRLPKSVEAPNKSTRLKRVSTHKTSKSVKRKTSEQIRITKPTAPAKRKKTWSRKKKLNDVANTESGNVSIVEHVSPKFRIGNFLPFPLPNTVMVPNSVSRPTISQLSSPDIDYRSLQSTAKQFGVMTFGSGAVCSTNGSSAVDHQTLVQYSSSSSVGSPSPPTQRKLPTLLRRIKPTLSLSKSTVPVITIASPTSSTVITVATTTGKNNTKVMFPVILKEVKVSLPVLSRAVVCSYDGATSTTTSSQPAVTMAASTGTGLKRTRASSFHGEATWIESLTTDKRRRTPSSDDAMSPELGTTPVKLAHPPEATKPIVGVVKPMVRIEMSESDPRRSPRRPKVSALSRPSVPLPRHTIDNAHCYASTLFRCKQCNVEQLFTVDAWPQIENHMQQLHAADCETNQTVVYEQRVHKAPMTSLDASTSGVTSTDVGAVLLIVESGKR